jgi:DNA helicase-2/ATP-dependent DNA helicase PcrA
VDNEHGAVTLMTLHASKGLEFPAAAIVGLEEGLLPHSRAQTSESELEEERRLAFVGITRAQDHLLMTSADRRTIRGISERTIRSRFFSEIGREHVLVEDRARYSDSAYDDAFDDTPTRRATERHDYGIDKINEAREKRLARPVERPTISSTPASRAPASAHEFEKGALVAHPQFGRGVVLSCTQGSNARVTVEFKGLGKKTLVLEYARLKRL